MRTVIKHLFRAILGKGREVFAAPGPADPPTEISRNTAPEHAFNFRFPELVAELDGATQEQIRTLFARAIGRQAVRDIARGIRPLLRLTPDQETELEAYRLADSTEVFAKHPRTDPSKLTERIDKRVQRERENLIRARADAIAHSEVMAFLSAQQEREWRTAARQGFFDPEKDRREWMPASNEQTCPICRAIPGLNPGGRKLGEPFKCPPRW